MADLDTREIHSLTRKHRASGNTWPRLLIEHDDTIRIVFGGGFEPESLVISSEDARYLAAKLNRLARRLENRAAKETPQ